MAAAHAFPVLARMARLLRIRFLFYTSLLLAGPLACNGQRDAEKPETKRPASVESARALPIPPTNASKKQPDSSVVADTKPAAPHIVLTSDRKSDQSRAIAALQPLGCSVERDDKQPDKPVIKIDFYGTKVVDADLKYLNELPTIQRLEFKGTSITDAGLQHLKGLDDLRELNLNFTAINGSGFVHLKNLSRLQELDLGFTKVTDAGIEHLKGITSLKILDLSLTPIGDPGLEFLLGLSNLQTLNLRSTKVTDPGVAKLQAALPRLRIER